MQFDSTMCICVHAMAVTDSCKSFSDTNELCYRYVNSTVLYCICLITVTKICIVGITTMCVYRKLFIVCFNEILL